MINHHPSIELLTQFSEGELPASIAAAVAIHVQMCPKCRAKCAELTELNAEQHFNSNSVTGELDAASMQSLPAHFTEQSIAAMVDTITSSDEIDLSPEPKVKTICVRGSQYQLPQALTNMAMGKWSSIGDIARARFDLDEEPVRASLLQIQPGGAVPEHTHKGFEITLLLDGSFKDDMGGIWLW